LLRLLRSMEGAPCAPDAHPDTSLVMVPNDAGFYCARCPQHVWPERMRAWKWAAQRGRYDVLRDDHRYVAALYQTARAHPALAERIRQAQCRALDSIIDHVLRTVDLNAFGWLVDHALVDVTDRRLWDAAAQHGRLDVVHWLLCHLDRGQCQESKEHGPIDSRDAAYQRVRVLFKGITSAKRMVVQAATGGSLGVMRWLLDMHGPLILECYRAYWRALSHGYVHVLDWLASRYDPLLRQWDECVKTSFYGDYAHKRNWSARVAIQAPTPASLEWLGARGCPFGDVQVYCYDYHPWNDGFAHLVPGSAKTLAYALDVCGFKGPSREDIVGMACCNEPVALKLAQELDARGLITDTTVYISIRDHHVRPYEHNKRILEWCAKRAFFYGMGASFRQENSLVENSLMGAICLYRFGTPVDPRLLSAGSLVASAYRLLGALLHGAPLPQSWVTAVMERCRALPLAPLLPSAGVVSIDAHDVRYAIMAACAHALFGPLWSDRCHGEMIPLHHPFAMAADQGVDIVPLPGMRDGRRIEVETYATVYVAARRLCRATWHLVHPVTPAKGALLDRIMRGQVDVDDLASMLDLFCSF